jgi:hypothetical protein
MIAPLVRPLMGCGGYTGEKTRDGKSEPNAFAAFDQCQRRSERKLVLRTIEQTILSTAISNTTTPYRDLFAVSVGHLPYSSVLTRTCKEKGSAR